MFVTIPNHAQLQPSNSELPRSSPISSHCSVRSLFAFHSRIASKFLQVCKLEKSGMGSFLDGRRTLSKKVIGVTSLAHIIVSRSMSIQ